MDLKRLSKALAGGAAAATGGTSTAFIIIPATANLAPWEMALIPLANFIVGFAIVFLAPANSPAQPPGA